MTSGTDAAYYPDAESAPGLPRRAASARECTRAWPRTLVSPSGEKD